MYRLIYFLLFFSFAFGIEIDIKNLEKNLQKDDVENRLLIAKYYLNQGDVNKSKKYSLEVLKLSPKNKRAKEFLTKISLKQKFTKYLSENNSSIEKVDEFYKNLYLKNRYQEIQNDSKYLFLIKSDYPKLITAKIFMWNGEYLKSDKILKSVKDKKRLDYLDTKANNCFYLENFKCAKNEFSILYSATYKLDYAYKLIDIYFFLNELDRANSLIDKLLKAYPKNKKIIQYRNKLNKLKHSQLIQLTKIYQKTQKFEDLQKLVYVLLNFSQTKKAYKLLQVYINKHPEDDNAKLWYATYLSWGGENEKALKILSSVKNTHNYKVKFLMAKILSWNGEYAKSINNLNEIITFSKDKNLIIDAKEVKGLIYYWQHDYKKAKPLLEEVLKHKSSIEAKEALMVMAGDLKPLIKKYLLLYKKESSNLEYILKIAQFSELTKDIDTAIKFYEKYYAINPKKEIAHSLAKLYLNKNNPYKAFGYYEYWAYQVDTKESLLELAQAYYYSGYIKSALNVIRDILRRYPKYKKAIDLKAKILRYNPKFTQNNSKKTLQDILNDKYQKLFQLANRLYFNGFYKEANTYFKKYLLDNPDDYETRERYAYSLEFMGEYRKASGEFFLLTWMKKDCNIMYNYAFNLEKSGKKAEANRAYKEAQSYSIRPLNGKLKTFIDNWKKAWESLDINKYKKFYSKKYRNNRLWLIKKESIFRRVNFISLYLAGESILSEKKENNSTIYEVRFYQQYTTNKKIDKGYKTLKIKCDKKCEIISEKWKKGKFNPPDYSCYARANGRMGGESPIINNISMKMLLRHIKKDKNVIVLSKELKRDFMNPKEVFASFEVNVSNKFTLPKASKNENNQIINSPAVGFTDNNRVGILGHYLKDSTNLRFLQYGAYYEYKFLHLDLQKWKLSRNSKERDGKFITLKLKHNAFIVGAEIGKYEDFNYVYPYLEYAGYFDYKLYQGVVGKDKQSFCAVDKNLSSVNVLISKYKKADVSAQKEITDYFVSLGLAKISDDNVVITPQFQYRFNKETHFLENWNLYYYLSGWYETNSKENSCYYSPKQYDSTFLELHPVYKNLELIGEVGYSFDKTTLLYGYGFDYQYNDSLKLNCMQNYSYRDGLSGYSYLECYLNAGIQW